MAYQTMNGFPLPLSAEETNRYLELASKGDEFAIKKLAEHNLRLVVSIAKKYENATYDNPDLEFNDIISIGSIGLMKAIRTFDINKDIKLATYASRCIDNEILMVLRNSKKHKLNISLETTLDKDNEGNEITIKDILSSNEIIEDNYIKKETYKRLRELLNCLPELKRKVIVMKYELELSQTQMADNLSYSRSYVSRIETAAKKEIAEHLQKEELFLTKKITDDMIKVKNMEIVDKVLYLADVFINSNTTIEKLAAQYNMSIRTIYNYFKYKLKDLDISRYEQISFILNEQNIQKTLNKHK